MNAPRRIAGVRFDRVRLMLLSLLAFSLIVGCQIAAQAACSLGASCKPPTSTGCTLTVPNDPWSCCATDPDDGSCCQYECRTCVYSPTGCMPAMAESSLLTDNPDWECNVNGSCTLNP